MAALQAVLAGEHAAVYAYGVTGAQLRGTTDEAEARSSFDLHRARRDRIASALVALDVEPDPPAAAYDLGARVTTPAAARALAARVEAAVIGPYADLVAVGEGSVRTSAAAWCGESAVRAVRWGGSPTPFPGLAERS